MPASRRQRRHHRGIVARATTPQERLRAVLVARGEDPDLPAFLVAIWCANPTSDFYGDSELERLAIEILESE
jgi:hypothetical protein